MSLNFFTGTSFLTGLPRISAVSSFSGSTESGIAPTYPYHQRFERVSAVGAANFGFSLTNFTDSTFVNCLGFGNDSNNWLLENNSTAVARWPGPAA
jgi:hypothetical protein